jgi:putative membrane protein
MQIGLFFRKEVVVAFRRIQDIHVNRNLIQRWLGIASVSVQTASGNAMPEIVLEGITDPDSVRDWLYERMRGAKGISGSIKPSSNAVGPSELPLFENESTSSDDEVTELLRGIRDNLAVMAEKVARKSGADS